MECQTIHADADIDLARVIFLYLKKWRSVLATMAVFAVVLGVYKGVAQTATEFNLKEIMVFCVLGAVMGAFLVACWVLTKEILSGKIACPADVKGRYGLFIVGNIHVWQEKKGTRLDRWLNRCLGHRTKVNTEEACRLMAAKIRLICHNGEKEVLLCGTADQKKIQEVCDTVGKYLPADLKLQVIANPAYHAEAAQMLQTADVILAEEIDRSTFRETDKIVELVSVSGRKVLGCILL
ncbi:MAG: hypothetical protein PUF71_03180 [Firmicutes bacterium]|nr:hypothetical protein [Bacillota bacterium]